MLFDFSQKVYKEISRTGYNNKTKLIFWRVFQLFPHTLSLRLLQSQSLSATIPSKHPPLVLQNVILSTFNWNHCHYIGPSAAEMGSSRHPPSLIEFQNSEFRPCIQQPPAYSPASVLGHFKQTYCQLSAKKWLRTFFRTKWSFLTLFWWPPFINQGATNSWRLYYILATPLPLMSIIIIGDPPMQNMQILE